MTGELARAAELIAAWDYSAARDLLVELLDAAHAAGRYEHLDTLTIRRMLAEALRELGEIDQARDMVSGVVRACRQRYGEHHPATVRALAGLGMVLHSAGELEQARQCYEQVVVTGPDTERPAGRAVLLARAQLALLARDEGDPLTAVRLLTGAYTEHRRVYGGGDLETIRLAAELGRLYSVLGDRPSARRQLAVAHAGAYAELGEEHPLTRLVEAALAEVEPPMPSAPEPLFGEGSTARRGRRRGARVKAARGRHYGWRLVAGLAGGLGTLLVVAGAVVEVASGSGTPGPGPGAAAGPVQRSIPPPMLKLSRAVPLAPRPNVSVPHPSAPRAPVPSPSAPNASVPSPSAPRAPALSPGPGRGAPRDVVLRDEGTSITVTWTDPTNGTGAVLIMLAKAGQPAGPLSSLPPGTHEHRITGLDPAADYCVRIAIVYAQDTMAQATEVCTHRVAPSAQRR